MNSGLFVISYWLFVFLQAKGLCMRLKNKNDVIGYSAFDLTERCYEYNENECLVFDTEESALFSVEDICGYTSGHRIEKVTIKKILKDYGASSGNFAFEPEALKKFVEIATNNKIKFTAAPWDESEELTIVEL